MVRGVMPGESGRRVFTVGELTRDIKGTLEGGFSGLWLEGEISNFKTYASGHSYFTLKDARAQISGVIWKGSKKYLTFAPRDGDLVVCRGRVSVYEPRGSYQFVVEAMEPKGLGALQAAFEQLKAKLDKEGLFGAERKKELPRIPWRVGIVTSPSGAVIRDMIRTLNRRFPGLHIIFAPAAVQGEGAARQIAQAIADLNEQGWVDVIIVGRGGGSLEDLWAFNEEVTARAIAASTIPVVSAVGHETDFTIADFVADKRASTPTAAAEIVAPERAGIEELIDERQRRLETSLRGRAETGAQSVDQLTSDLDRELRREVERLSEKVVGALRHLRAVSPRNRLERDRQSLRGGEERLTSALLRLTRDKKSALDTRMARFDSLRPERFLDERKGALTQIVARLDAIVTRDIVRAQGLFDVAFGALNAYSPQATLERGYSIVRACDGGDIIRAATEIQPGEKVSLQFAKGACDATIEGERKKRQESLF